MIFFDTTKAFDATHRSGLVRVTERLVDELGPCAAPVRWPGWDRKSKPEDWFVTAELFCEWERPGFSDFIESRVCRTAAIFHDAIPMKLPHVTWPRSVARHPAYMKLLSRFDRVFAVSEASKRELEGFWQWQGAGRRPPVDVLGLGADMADTPRVPAPAEVEPGVPRLLSVGIIEPRKNQGFLLDVCEALWKEGLDFELHLVGRVNPRFGGSIAKRARKLARAGVARLKIHGPLPDSKLLPLYATARATVFPTIAEGGGLPLLESLWMGVPCVCSDVPALLENASGGGCLVAKTCDAAAWADALREILTDELLPIRLATEARTRPLPTWAETARQLRGMLDSVTFTSLESWSGQK